MNKEVYFEIFDKIYKDYLTYNLNFTDWIRPKYIGMLSGVCECAYNDDDISVSEYFSIIDNKQKYITLMLNNKNR